MSANGTIGRVFPRERDESNSRDAITPMLKKLLDDIERLARLLYIIEERGQCLEKAVSDLFELSMPLCRRPMDEWPDHGA